MLRRPSALLLTSFAALLAQAPPLPEPPAPLGIAEVHAHRQALARAVAAAGGPAVILVRGAGKRADMGAFVQDQDFLYLTGVAEPDLAVLLVADGDGKLTNDELLVPPFSRFAATWEGTYLAPGEAAAKQTGFAVVANVRTLEARLATVLAAGPDGKRPPLYTLLQAAPSLGSTPGQAQGTAAAVQKDPLDGRTSREEALAAHLRSTFAGLDVKGLEPFLHQLRTHKSDAEIELLRESAHIAAEGLTEAIQGARPGLYEFQLAAAARYVFSLRGAGPDAYAAIVGAGPNGCVLHYMKNDRKLRPDDLVVMDYAPTLHGYASDVTRTFPASGRFSPAQRKLVQDVCEIQQALLAMVKPGARLGDLGATCAQLLKERGYASDHGPCHHVGLAVHDPSVDELAPGMVITVEPGAYLRDQGMGCRIEDTVLVTATGHEVLSAGVPSTPDAIEALMRKKGVLDGKAGGAK